MTDDTRGAMSTVSPDLARCHALAALPPEAIEEHLDALLALLRDPSWRVRREAALALARMRDPSRAVEPLLDAVEGSDVLARNAALEALRNVGAPAHPAVLARLVASRDPSRRFLIEALLEGADVSCVAPLRALLDDADGNIPAAAAEALGAIADGAALEALAVAVAHRDPVVRLAALLAFEARETVTAWSEVAALVDDPVCGVHAVRALARQRDARSLARVAGAVVSPQRRTAIAATLACARVLQARGSTAVQLLDALRAVTGAVTVLLARATVGVTAHRVAAWVCLGALGDPATVGAALDTCADRDAEVATAAESALDRFDGALAPAAVSRSLRAPRPVLRAALAWALRRGRDDDARALTALAWQCLDASSVAPAAAWELVARFGTDDDLRLLAERAARTLARARHEVDGLVPALERALARSPVEVDALVRAFVSSSEGGLRIAAALHRAGLAVDPSVFDEALADPVPEVRAAALRALVAAGRAPSADTVRALARDGHPGVRAALADAVRGAALDAHELTALLSDRTLDGDLRAASVSALAAHVAPDDARLRAALDDTDDGVALEALRALDASPDGAHLDAALAHHNGTVVVEALMRLRERDPERASARALTLLGHGAPAVRAASIRCLRGPRRVLRALLAERLQREDDDEVRAALDEALAGGPVPVEV